MDTHLNVSTHDKPNTCQACKKGFSQKKKKLSVHLSEHSGERNFHRREICFSI